MSTDVIITTAIPADGLACAHRVLEASGAELGQVIVVVIGHVPELAAPDPRLVVSAAPDAVAACNVGLERGRSDVVLVNAAALVTPGWLVELAAVARAHERTACVEPVRGGAGDAPGAHLGGLPRATLIPSTSGCCVYLRRAVLDLLGGFDAIYADRHDAEHDWVMRAEELGFVAYRANHALVRCAARHEHPPSPILRARHPEFAAQRAAFATTLDAELGAHALRIQASGGLRVALDLRALGTPRMGSRVYAHALAEALASSPAVELTLLERCPQHLERLGARVLLEPDGTTPLDVEIIHRPHQLVRDDDLPALFESPAHLVLTYQDLILYHAQGLLAADAHEHYRALSSVTVQAAQAVIAISGCARREIAEAFGVPEAEIHQVHHGIAHEDFAGEREARAELRRRLRLPGRYFLAVGMDYPHKNLANLVLAYQLLVYEWRPAFGPLPELVMVGLDCEPASGFYRRLRAACPVGVHHLGEVDDDVVRALYQGAEALVYPSVYEGFGLPPLEAMAAGVPVIALPLSAVHEVCGAAALYPADPRVESLALTMMRLARTPELRAERIAIGQRHAAAFTTARMLERTLAAYTAAWRHPSERSLRMRRYARTLGA